jgi:predicted amidophosphoribosyltransferase
LRGFNQSTKIAVGISEIIGIPVNDKLVERIKSTSTQTKKTKVERWENVDAVYRILSTKLLENKEVIIVDDVITTGATIGALCELIQPFVSKIYILSIATGK